VSKIAWVADTGRLADTDFAAVATARTMLSVIAPANKVLTAVSFEVSFEQGAGADLALQVELCACTQATAGTSSAVTPAQLRGKGATVGASAAKIFTAEPTTITVLKTKFCHPFGGPYLFEHPLGREVDSEVADAVLLRCKWPTGATRRAGALNIEFEEG